MSTGKLIFIITGSKYKYNRIGRTGRASSKGVAYTFLSEDMERLARKIAQVLEAGNTKVPTCLS